jgi:hypothetical protein
MGIRRSDHNNKEKISAEEKIGQVEFLRRRAIIETVKSPFFNLQIFTDGQEELQERNEERGVHAPTP